VAGNPFLENYLLCIAGQLWDFINRSNKILVARRFPWPGFTRDDFVKIEIYA